MTFWNSPHSEDLSLLGWYNILTGKYLPTFLMSVVPPSLDQAVHEMDEVSTNQHSITSQKTWIFIHTAVTTSFSQCAQYSFYCIYFCYWESFIHEEADVDSEVSLKNLLCYFNFTVYWCYHYLIDMIL